MINTYGCYYNNTLITDTYIYKIINNYIFNSYNINILSEFGTNNIIANIHHNNEINILLNGESTDVSILKDKFPYINIFISFQPSQYLGINKSSNIKQYNIQALLPVYWNYISYFNLNKQFINNFLYKKNLNNKLEFCTTVISNPGYNKYYTENKEMFKDDICLTNIRKQLFYYINDNYKQIQSGGYWNNTTEDRMTVKDKNEFIKQSIFNLCFENSVHQYYITEKIFDSFRAGCIPIYAGDNSNYINEIFNKNMFINCLDENNRLKEFSDILDEIKEFEHHIINMSESDIKNIQIYNKKNFIELEQIRVKNELFQILNEFNKVFLNF